MTPEFWTIKKFGGIFMRFSKEDKLQMYQLKEAGVSYTEIQKLYGIDQGKLSPIISNVILLRLNQVKNVIQI